MGMIPIITMPSNGRLVGFNYCVWASLPTCVGSPSQGVAFLFPLVWALLCPGPAPLAGVPRKKKSYNHGIDTSRNLLVVMDLAFRHASEQIFFIQLEKYRMLKPGIIIWIECLEGSRRGSTFQHYDDCRGGKAKGISNHLMLKFKH